MSEFFIYFIKVNLGLALFYLLFSLVFYRDTFWIGRRIYLVAAVVLSFLYPLISLSGWLRQQEPVQVFIAEWSQLQDFTVRTATENTFSWETILCGAYALVSAFFLIRLLIQTGSIFRWLHKSSKSEINGVPVRLVSEEIMPFSFFKFIFIHSESYKQEELREIMTHECTHVKQWHSLDVLLSEILTTVCWINPAAWLLKREIRQNLEFLADNKVIKSGCDTKNYQYHLMRLAFAAPNIEIVNKLNVLPLKKRIIMMNQKKSTKTELLKYLLIIPLILTLVLTSNAETLLSSAKEMLAEMQQKPADSQPNRPADDEVFMVVEKMPQFPGGTEAMFQFLAKNIKYPVEAQTQGTEGRVIVQFVVDKNGKIRDTNIIRSLSPETDKEAIRVVEAMPDWLPGEQRGEKVSVKYTLPIAFKLSESDKKIETGDADLVVVGYGGKQTNETVFQVVDKMPEFPGGVKEMVKYLYENVKYPLAAKEQGIQGRVICQFVVKADGSIGDVKVVRSAVEAELVAKSDDSKNLVKVLNSANAELLDIEAIRVVKSMPKWVPGEQRGEKVNVQYTLPINFKLSDDEKKDETQTQVKTKQERPLVIIDDVNMPKDFDISSIDANTIESINVLKNGNEVVKTYGEDAKNGVIIITTKRNE